MSRIILALSLATVLSSQAYAYVQEVNAIDVSREMAEWNRDFSTRSRARLQELNIDLTEEGYTECAGVNEIVGAYICASYDQVNMNRALGRASFFVEGLDGTPAGTVLKAKDPSVERYNRLIGGHDLKSEDLLRFWAAVQSACEKDSSYCATNFEIDLFNTFIVPKSQEQERFVVITYASQSRMRYTDVVTHEIMHAQYFLDDAFRATADKFWNERVSETDRDAVRQILSSVYDASNELLMINEFQAYMLMADAEQHMLRQFVGKYRQDLMDAMTAQGIEPVQVR